MKSKVQYMKHMYLLKNVRLFIHGEWESTERKAGRRWESIWSIKTLRVILHVSMGHIFWHYSMLGYRAKFYQWKSSHFHSTTFFFFFWVAIYPEFNVPFRFSEGLWTACGYRMCLRLVKSCWQLRAEHFILYP